MMEFKFSPTEKFTWIRKYEDGTEVFIGEYHPGMTYNCTKKPVHDALREQCKVWEKEGKIVKIPLSPGQSFKIVKVPAKEGK